MNDIAKQILSEVQNARTDSPVSKVIYESDVNPGKNEMLFFIKPELTNQSDSLDYDTIYSMILEKITEYGFSIQNIRVINAPYLKKYNIIAQHYGVINAIARNVKENISDNAIHAFKNQYGLDFNGANVAGGLELMNLIPGITEEKIQNIWVNGDLAKVGGGTYCIQCNIEGKEYFLFNGFHPMQMKHFTAKNRCIVTFSITGNCNWDSARQDFIGATNPEKANKGSVRNLLFTNKDDWGIDEVSYSQNGAHLSAGPIEGLVELIRYNSDHEESSETKKEYSFQTKLASVFSNEIIKLILSNPTVNYKGDNESVFDLTEEMNSEEAIQLLKEIDWK